PPSERRLDSPWFPGRCRCAPVFSLLAAQYRQPLERPATSSFLINSKEQHVLCSSPLLRCSVLILCLRPLRYRSSANATMALPESAPFFPPPHTMTTYCLPFTV